MSAHSARTVVLTGATGRLGRHIAENLAKQGNSLALVVRDRYRGEEIARELGRTCPDARVQVHFADLASCSSVKDLSRALLHTYSQVDVLVNCAAVTSPPPHRQLSKDQLDVTFHTNAVAPFQLMVLLAPLLMRAGKHAKVVNVASSTGLPIVMRTTLSDRPVPHQGHLDHWDQAVRMGLAQPPSPLLDPADVAVPFHDYANPVASAGVYCMYPLVTGRLDLDHWLPKQLRYPYQSPGPLGSEEELQQPRPYDGGEAYVQSKIALRHLSWAAGSYYEAMNSSIQVHCCHPGKVETPALQNFGLAGGLSTASKAASVPTFLASDRRLHTTDGQRSFYWNELLRGQRCEYMNDLQACLRTWLACEAFTGCSLKVSSGI
uniref:Protochlorophyllide reductase n=1 Tax=Rhizochromulina marina TaxID=1034831 RepID=A0A7S2WJM9_9STRA|mmetsp:Transcript_26643/g.77539  ORF Transcript_26643/g.77539 Transcript_26643/m.77539 type:complete len:376 (+) Transcript_26643:49-1176(+)